MRLDQQIRAQNLSPLLTALLRVLRRALKFQQAYSLFPSRHRTTLSAFFAAAKPLILSSPFAPEKFAS